jgi:hypothetical protein
MGTEALTVRFLGNEYANTLAEMQEIEGFNGVFSLQSAKD